MTACRHIHVIARIKSPKNSSLLDLYKNCRVIGIPSLRYASTNETTSLLSSSSSELPPSSSSSPPVSASPPQNSPYDEIPGMHMEI